MPSGFVSLTRLREQGPGASDEAVVLHTLVERPVRAFYPVVEDPEPRPLDAPEGNSSAGAAAESGSEAPVEAEESWTTERVEALLAEAEERGRAQAEAALEASRRRLEAQHQHLLDMTLELELARQRRAAEAGDLVGEFLMAALSRVLRTVPEVLEGLLRHRIPLIAEQMISSEEVVLSVRPEDVELARRLVGSRAGWTVRADAQIGGGCLAVGSTGTVDATVATAIAAVDEAIQGWRDEARTLGDARAEAA